MKKDFAKKEEIMICCYLIAAAPPCFLPRLKRVLLNASFRVFLFGSVVVPS